MMAAILQFYGLRHSGTSRDAFRPSYGTHQASSNDYCVSFPQHFVFMRRAWPLPHSLYTISIGLCVINRFSAINFVVFNFKYFLLIFITPHMHPQTLQEHSNAQNEVQSTRHWLVRGKQIQDPDLRSESG